MFKNAELGGRLFYLHSTKVKRGLFSSELAVFKGHFSFSKCLGYICSLMGHEEYHTDDNECPPPPPRNGGKSHC